MQAFLTDNFDLIDDPYTADMLRLYFLIKAGIVNITYEEYESMNERDVTYIAIIAEADVMASNLKNKERQFAIFSNR